MKLALYKELNVKSLVKDTVIDRGVKDAVVKDVESVKETEENDASKTDQQSKQHSKFMKIKSETPGHPKISKLKTVSRVSRQRQIISVKKMKKLVKQKEPVFMAVVWAQKENEPSAKAAAVSTSQGLTEKKKRLIMKEVGPKKRFLTVKKGNRRFCLEWPPSKGISYGKSSRNTVTSSPIHFQRDVPRKGTLFTKLILNLALNRLTELHIG